MLRQDIVDQMYKYVVQARKSGFTSSLKTTIIRILCEIWGSYGDENDEVVFLEFDAM
jgi:hypothetical protein